MAITSKGLEQLGFDADTDFLLEDHGSGIEMKWLSGAAQPTVSAIETAHATWQTAYDANEAAKTTGRDKLVALGLTTAELDALGIE
jgi:hypothetical protein